jgi:hypothetical protein
VKIIRIQSPVQVLDHENDKIVYSVQKEHVVVVVFLDVVCGQEAPNIWQKGIILLKPSFEPFQFISNISISISSPAQSSFYLCRARKRRVVVSREDQAYLTGSCDSKS